MDELPCGVRPISTDLIRTPQDHRVPSGKWQTPTSVLTVVPFPLMSAIALPAVGDPSATRTVYATIIVLLLLAIALTVLAVWLFRHTRPDPELLAPLEEMDTRSFRRADPDARSELLDSARPARAKPVGLTLLAADDADAAEQSAASTGDETDDEVAADAAEESRPEADEVPADADEVAAVDEVVDDGDVEEDDTDEDVVENAVETAIADDDRGGGDGVDDTRLGIAEEDDSTSEHGIVRDSTPAS